MHGQKDPQNKHYACADTNGTKGKLVMNETRLPYDLKTLALKKRTLKRIKSFPSEN